MLTDKLIPYDTGKNPSQCVEGIGLTTSSLKQLGVYINATAEMTEAQFKTWLSTNNVTVYYVLANPTYTIITEQALINQLEAIKYSMNGTTIITQTNEDKPFELDVKALMGQTN